MGRALFFGETILEKKEKKLNRKMRIKERYEGVIKWFSENMEQVETELHYEGTYELLVAVILSAQCTDERVNMSTPALFEAYPTLEELSKATPEEVLEYIGSITYPNNKSKHLVNMANMVMDDFGGEIPNTLENLEKLPGVGRKTANVVGSIAFGKHVMPVDTHVFRVSERIGLTVGAKTPLQTEKQLTRHFPHELLPKAHHWLILHGRYVCTARSPKCDKCGIIEYCKYGAKLKRDKAKKEAKKEAKKADKK